MGSYHIKRLLSNEEKIFPIAFNIALFSHYIIREGFYITGIRTSVRPTIIY